MKTLKTFLLIGLVSFVWSCSKYKDYFDLDRDEYEDTEVVTVEYAENTSDIPNPDRGFYRYSETRASGYTLLNEEDMRGYRTTGTVSGANYTTISTLVFRYFVLDGLNDKPIPQDYLDNVQADFEAARNAGVKLIPRFAYTTTPTSGDCPAGFICSPYGDAPKDIVLGHIAQLGPILTENADVISTIQMGFIGTWGENYYTDYFGDASVNADQGKLLDENWQDRIDVLKALLDATPDDMMIQARYPQMKQRYVYGIDAPTTSAALTEAEAFDGSDKARIAFHNDCLLAGPGDFGTYNDYGNSSTPALGDVANLKPYFADDSKFVIIGGETCFDSDAYTENNCAPAGMADTDLRELHYTYLNSAYNNDVNNDWVDGGCIEDIKKNLGYRFVLSKGMFPNKVTGNQELNVILELRNTGYASSMHERNVDLVLRNTADGETISFPFETDTRYWFSEVTLTQTVELPDALSNGDYEVLLQISDDDETLSTRAEYSVQLANMDTWESETGLNNLNHVITVE